MSPTTTSPPPSSSFSPLSLSFLMVVVTALMLAVEVPGVRTQDVQYSIWEEGQPSAFVGNVARDVNLEAQIPSSVFESLHYSILTGTGSGSGTGRAAGSHGNLFAMDQDTSDLFTARSLDRESLCPFSLECRLDFKVIAVASSSSSSYVKNVKVRVLLKDVNDNAPRFNRSTFALDISESVTVGAAFSLEGAVDDDTGVNNSVKNYTLSPGGDGPFRVEFAQKLDRTSDVHLIVRQPLDREAWGFYSLQLVAWDGGDPPQTAEMEVWVTVTDDNDNPPEFSQKAYSVTIGENVKPGERILTVSASDDDAGVNAEVRYLLSPHQDGMVASLFAVDAVSGDLTLQQLPASGGYSVIVQAVDGGSPRKETQVVVEVKVIDTANNPPLIAVTLLSPAIPEDSALKTPVAHVSVEDPDSGRNGQVSCFSQSAYFDLRRLEESDMMVELALSLDREDSPSYQVTLFCQDSGSPTLNATVTFDVLVDDVNDNPPRFAQSDVTFSVTEGDRVGEIVHTLTATDRDIGENAEVKYRLTDAGADDVFYVLDASGSVVVAKEIDRERQERYVFRVVALDRGTSSLSSTVTVTINIDDVNDEVPEFSQDQYEFTILENRAAGAFVGVFNATDPDLGEGGKVSFRLHSSSHPQVTSALLLHPNGTLVTRGMLDRESSPEMVFDVTASDQGTPRLSSSRKVKVVVEDVNDNRPLFQFPGPTNYSVTLLIPVLKETHLFTLSVVDADLGANSVVSYSLSSANLTSLFSVDTWTGLVWTRTELGEDHVGTHNLTFRATDGGEPPLSSDHSLLLTLKLNPASSPVSSEDDNAVIAISIVCATLFIAVLVVVVVFLLRRRDKGSDLKYVNNNNNNSSDSSNKEKTTSSKDVYMEPQRTPSMFFTAASKGGPHGDRSPKLSIGYPEEPGQFPTRKWSSGQQSTSPLWVPDPPDLQALQHLEGRGDEGDGGDLQTVNRVTSLRLQQAFEHISSIKSQLITGSDTGKPYEWREIHVPGRPDDFNSLSSRATTINGDSGLGTADEDAVFLTTPTPTTTTHHNHSLPRPHPHPHPQHPQPPHSHTRRPLPVAATRSLPPRKSRSNPSHQHHHHQQPPPPHSLRHHNNHHHSPSPNPLPAAAAAVAGAGQRRQKSSARSLSQPGSDRDSPDGSGSQPESCSSLPIFFLKPGSDIFVFRPTSATSCESSPSMDDNCTTTSGSYSINFEEPLASGVRGVGGLRGGGGSGLEKKFCHVQDVYV